MTDDCARVRVYPDDKARINDLRQGSDTQADVVARLLDGDTESLYQVGDDTPVDEIARQVGQQINTDAELPTADIREAAREGAREAIEQLEGRP